MAKDYDRLCITLPLDIIEELKAQYPHDSFSSLCAQLIRYACAAGFMTRLGDIDPADYDKPAAKPKRTAAKAISRAAKMVAQAATMEDEEDDDSLEDFGIPNG